MAGVLGNFGAFNFGKITVLRTDLDAHTALTTAHSAVAAATANRMVVRDASARALMADPPASDSTGLIATTNWVQGEISGAGGVTSITQGTGMNFSVNPIVATGTINLANTAVTPNTYNFATITVDAQGRLTAASAGSPVTSVGGTAPVVSSGGATPAISMAAATGSVNGYMTSVFATKLNGIEALAEVNDVDTVFGRTGAVVAATNDYNISQIDGVTISDSGPSGGSDGDIWFEY